MFNNEGEMDSDFILGIIGLLVLFLIFLGTYFLGRYNSYNGEMNKLISKSEQIISYEDKHYQIQIKEITIQGLKEIKESK